MRLTVGPLSAGVYWRRRALVFVGLAMVVLVVSYACGGPDVSNAGAGVAASQSAAASDPAPSAGPTVQTPILPNVTTPPPTAFSLPNTGATGPCTDAEMDVTVAAVAPQAKRGQPLDISIRIKNTSGRTCGRDVGADVQELRLMDQDIVVWSSDDCNARTGKDVRSFEPGKEVTFTLTWSGNRSRTGANAKNCNAPAPDPAPYQLVARLDQKMSPPFNLRLT
jgi:hypothetical protein